MSIGLHHIAKIFKLNEKSFWTLDEVKEICLITSILHGHVPKCIKTFFFLRYAF